MALGRKKDDTEAAAAPPPEAEVEAPESEEPAAAVEPAPPPEPAAAPAAGNDNALLGMFEASKLEFEDLSVLTNLAGDVELSDVLEDLYTVASALGIRVDSAAEDDLAA